MSKFKSMFKTNLIDENPTLVSFLGLCPTLGVTISLTNSIGMGLSVIFVLTLSNVVVSLIRNVVPTNVRIPVYITVIATLVTIVGMFLQAYIPSLYSTLGIYLPLIVVNCIILGRAEAFASKNNVKDSFLDGITVGLAFTITICVIGLVREFFGTGSINLGFTTLEFFNSTDAITIFQSGAGAFFTVGILAWFFNVWKSNKEKEKKAKGANK